MYICLSPKPPICLSLSPSHPFSTLYPRKSLATRYPYLPAIANWVPAAHIPAVIVTPITLVLAQIRPPSIAVARSSAVGWPVDDDRWWWWSVARPVDDDWRRSTATSFVDDNGRRPTATSFFVHGRPAASWGAFVAAARRRSEAVCAPDFLFGAVWGGDSDG